MPVDPSIPLQAGQNGAQPTNPLDLFGKYQGIANAQAANEMIKANTAQTQQSTAQSGGNYMAQKYASFLSLPIDMQTQSAARQFVDHSLAEGSITPQVAAVMHDKINKTGDVRGLQTLAIQGMVGNLGGQQALDNVFGSTTTHDVGPSLVPGLTPSPLRQSLYGAPGLVQTGGDLTKGLTPPEQIQPHTIPAVGPDGIPTGASTVVTGSQLAARSGNQHLLPGGGIPGDGRFPPALLNPSKPSAPDSSPAPQAAPGMLGTTLTPAQSAEQGATGASSSGVFQGIAQRGSQAKVNAAQLGNVLSDAEMFKTGTGTDLYKRVARGLQSAGLNVVDPDKITAMESMKKLLSGIVSSQNAGSDARAAIVESSNPDYNMSPDGLKYVTRQALGLEQYNQAVADMARKTGNRADSTKFLGDVRETLNPQAFQLDQLPPDQAKMFIKGLPAQQKSQLKADYLRMRQMGYVGAGNGGQ